MKMRVAQLGWSTASEQDGPVHVAPAKAHELPIATSGRRVGGFWWRGQREYLSELCFPTFFKGDGAIRPWQH